MKNIQNIDLELEKFFGFLMQFTNDNLEVSENNILHYRNLKYQTNELLKEAIEKGYIICIGKNDIGVNVYTITDLGRELRDYRR